MIKRERSSIIKKISVHLLIITIIGLIAYSDTFDVPFQFDDIRVVVENPFIRNIENLTSITKAPVLNPLDEYNPRRYMGYLSLALNYHWRGLNVTGYHIFNLLIHLANAILVYFLVSLTFKTPFLDCETLNVNGEKSGERRQETGDESRQLPEHNSSDSADPPGAGDSSFIALFAALLFVSHPVQTQAVTYIAQRFTSLAAMFYLLSIVMYIRGRLATVKSEKLVVSSEKAGNSLFTIHYSHFSIVWYLLSIVSAVLAMKTKEIAFTLPIMILLYEFTFFRSSLKKKLLFLLPVLLTLVIIPISMIDINRPLGEVLSDLSEKTRLQTEISRGDYLMTELRVIITYIRLIFLPLNQNIDYDYPIYHSFFTPPVFLSFLFLSALFGTAVYLLYKSHRAESKEQSVESSMPSALCALRLVAFGILWFFITLSVESSFIPIVDVIFEHRVYLPSIGAFVALSAALYAAAITLKYRWPRTEKAVFPLALIMVVVLSGATFARNRVWQDELALWEDVVRKSPGNPRAHNNLGFQYNEKGMNDLAIEQFLSALRLRPDYLDARINLGIAYNAKGMNDLAIEHFILALSMRPDDADAYNNLGIALVSKGMTDEGITQYKTALRLQPDYPEAYNNLGVAYGSKGLFDQAREIFEHAIRLKPDYFEAYHNLALVYEKMGDYEKAAALKNKAKDMNPAYR